MTLGSLFEWLLNFYALFSIVRSFRPVLGFFRHTAIVQGSEYSPAGVSFVRYDFRSIF